MKIHDIKLRTPEDQPGTHDLRYSLEAISLCVLTITLLWALGYVQRSTRTILGTLLITFGSLVAVGPFLRAMQERFIVWTVVGCPATVVWVLFTSYPHLIEIGWVYLLSAFGAPATTFFLCWWLGLWGPRKRRELPDINSRLDKYAIWGAAIVVLGTIFVL